MNNINIGKKELIHFVGIGGIGMSGLSSNNENNGIKCSEVILIKNKNTEIAKSRYEIFRWTQEKNILNATIIVRSSAIKNNNIEIDRRY